MSTEFFVWDESYLTGLEQVDKQHQALVCIINEMVDVSIGGDRLDLKTIEDMYYRLARYAVEHFDTEDGIMEEAGLASEHIAEHLAEHNAFVQSVLHLFRTPEELLDQGRFGEVVTYLTRWLAYHVLAVDKSMARQVLLVREGRATPEEACMQECTQETGASDLLIRALRSLFLLVAEKNAELSRKNQELEERVRERTTQLSLANEKLASIAQQDDLTGLPNRRYVVQELWRLIKRWQRYGAKFSALYIDLNNFKAVNDTHGHECGDAVLIWVATFLQRSVRRADVVCRIGGDEFLVICAHCNRAGAEALAKKLTDNCRPGAGHDIEPYWSPSLSIGVAEMDDTVTSPEAFLAIADEAMYRTKRMCKER